MLIIRRETPSLSSGGQGWGWGYLLVEISPIPLLTSPLTGEGRELRMISANQVIQ